MPASGPAARGGGDGRLDSRGMDDATLAGDPPAAAPRRWGPFVFRTIGPGHPFADLEPALAILGGGLLAALALLPLDALAPLAGTCSFRDLTGYPCATCGTTRAVLALGHGRLLAALRFNPLVTLALCALCAYAPVAAYVWFARRRRPRIGLAGRIARVAAVCAVIAAVAAQWIFLVIDGR